MMGGKGGKVLSLVCMLLGIGGAIGQYICETRPEIDVEKLVDKKLAERLPNILYLTSTEDDCK